MIFDIQHSVYSYSKVLLSGYAYLKEIILDAELPLRFCKGQEGGLSSDDSSLAIRRRLNASSLNPMPLVDSASRRGYKYIAMTLHMQTIRDCEKMAYGGQPMRSP